MQNKGKWTFRPPLFRKRNVCQITGLDTVTVDTWLIRGILETTKVDGRVLRGRRLFSMLAIFEATVTAELVNGLAVPPSEASKVARCATADWNAPGDWKRKVVEAIERSANVAASIPVAGAGRSWVGHDSVLCKQKRTASVRAHVEV